MNIIINNAKSLREAIKLMEEDQLEKKHQLVYSYKQKINSYRPVNILKSSITNISKGSLKKTAAFTGIGLGAVFMLRKYLFRKTTRIPFTLISFLGKLALGAAISRVKK